MLTGNATEIVIGKTERKTVISGIVKKKKNLCVTIVIKIAHCRDRDRDDRRHDKDREREHKPTNDSVADDGVKRRKVIPSELSVVGEESNQPSREKSAPRKEPELNNPTKGDDRNPRDANTDHKSANLPFNGSTPSGPRALQPPPMSPRTMRTIPTGPAASIPPGHPEHPRSKHSSSSADAINTHNSQNGHPTRKSSGQDHARDIEDSYKPRDAAQSSHASVRTSRDNASNMRKSKGERDIG
ncbi:hypothetical protein Pst134EB_027175 [Puccinia striiformis f. sp. tritici]|uniref:Uncharacterized protein n=2 Tax=Puccinia striiformis TaxID=27350 RepID=A0A2S4V8J5_9BASI|nr:hypothetical protein Pst134EB_027168 [Puccinia striiformis f. sp. tritici]KAH9442821.1 hypothetical protein Pst134EB_027175 [Puccinia striiformis f. sp. tritici]POW05863.1 hypothetical protein PSTT_09385 [Puccinia striiformis]